MGKTHSQQLQEVTQRAAEAMAVELHPAIELPDPRADWGAFSERSIASSVYQKRREDVIVFAPQILERLIVDGLITVEQLQVRYINQGSMADEHNPEIECRRIGTMDVKKTENDTSASSAVKYVQSELDNINEDARLLHATECIAQVLGEIPPAYRGAPWLIPSMQRLGMTVSHLRPLPSQEVAAKEAPSGQ